MKPPDKTRADRALDPTALESDSLSGEIGSKYTPRAATQVEEPEHQSDRRRFLVWALMLGAVPPERVVERVVAELEQDTP